MVTAVWRRLVLGAVILAGAGCKVKVDLNGPAYVGVGDDANLIAYGDPNEPGGYYTWTVSDGGGTISPQQGPVVKFTAPSTPVATTVTVTYEIDDDPKYKPPTDNVATDSLTIQAVDADHLNVVGLIQPVKVGDIWVTGVGPEWDIVSFNLVLNPASVTPAMLPSEPNPYEPNMIHWSGDGHPTSNPGQYVISTAQPGTYTVSVRVGKGNPISATLKVVKIVPPLAVTGALPKDPTPDTYYAGRADQGDVRVTATLSPACTDAEAQAVLRWEGSGQPDGQRGWVNRFVPRNTAGSFPIMAKVGWGSTSVPGSIASVTVDVVQMTITGFTPNPTYAVASQCNVANHVSQTHVATVPAGYNSAPWTVYSIQGDAHGASVDTDGAVTPGSSNSGLVTVRAALLGCESGYSDAILTIAPHPTRIAGTTSQPYTPQPGELVYGCLFTHTFDGTGGLLMGAIVAETIVRTNDPFDFSDMGTRTSPSLDSAWVLDVLGVMTTPDHVLLPADDIPNVQVDVNKFLPTGPPENKPGLPQTDVCEQTFYWLCPLCSLFSGFTTVDIMLTLEFGQPPGSFEVVTTDSGISYVQDYIGPALSQ
jgi:hypothetical protein